jgi:acyl carrier protein
MLLPFSWAGVSLYAIGASTLRVHMTPTGPDAVSLTLEDTTGQPVASIDSVILRPVSPEQLQSARRDAPDERNALDEPDALNDVAARPVPTAESTLPGGFVHGRMRRVTETVPGESGGPGVAPRADTASLRDRLSGLPEVEQGEFLLDLVRTQIATVLGHSSPDAVGPGRVFRDLGFDSLAVVELRDRLGAATGLQLPVNTVFGHPTAAALADHLRVALVGAPTNLSGELDRIEAALSRLGRDDDTLGTVTARLAALLDKYGAPIEKAADAAEAVASATDDELFTFIDNHL